MQIQNIKRGQSYDCHLLSATGGGGMNTRNFIKASVLAFITILLLVLMFCKPTSTIPAKLILHAPLYGTARANGTPYLFGDVTNVGGGVAYDGKLIVIVNEGEVEYVSFLGDFEPGECKSFECDLVGYCSSDETRCTFRLMWNHERMLACVSMDSLRLSIGD